MGYPEFHQVHSLLGDDETTPDPSVTGNPGREPQNMSDDLLYRSAMMVNAMGIVNEIKGLEFESFPDWETHVVKVFQRIMTA